MKIKNKLQAAILAMSVLLSSCSDSFLDMQNYGAYDDFNSESKVKWFLASLYYDYYKGYQSPANLLVGRYSEDWNNLTNEQWGIDAGSKIDPNSHYKTIDDIKTWEISSNKYVDPLVANYFGTPLGSSVQNTAYTRIRNCNILLRDIDEASSISDETKQYAKGQAYFLRAVQLFDLVRWYGPVPIVTSVINATTSSEQLPRASVSKCVEQIMKDLNEATHLLPPSWDASNYGRPTSETALAYKSRVLLTYASPIFNKNWDSPQSDRWQKALRATQKAIAEITKAGPGGCSSAREWGELLANDKNTFQQEAIFVKLLSTEYISGNSENNSWEPSLRPSSQLGKGGKKVPIEFIDLFPMADGTRPKDSDKIANGNIRFIENRDPRFYQTFAFSGLKWGYKEKPNDVVWAYRWKQSTGGSGFSYSDKNNISSPAFVRKMSGLTTSSTETYKGSAINIYEFRYAELLLNLAECYAATNDIQNCKQTLAKLRHRVGIEEGSSYYGLDKTVRDRHSALESCLYERQIELAFEGKRFWDIWRWLLYDGGQGDGLQLSTTNTCQSLNIPSINGTSRTSMYIDLKAGSYTPSDTDELLSARATISADPNSADFAQEIKKLADFWEANFEFGAPSSAGDKDSNNNLITPLWRPNYYIHGLTKAVLDNNSWLGQTKGWSDQNGASGSISWQDDESISDEIL